MITDPALAVLGRRLIRSADRAALAVRLPKDAPSPDWPYASLVLVAADHDGAPLLLMSDLAEHSSAIKADPRVGLLFDGTTGHEQPLTGPRLSVTGTATRSLSKRHSARYLARHPSAELYAGFADFRLYRVAVEQAHLVVGFGRINWIGGATLLMPEAGAAPLATQEAEILERMNGEQGPDVDALANHLVGRHESGWRLTGVDPEGCDLRRGGAVARLDFTTLARDADDARAELANLIREARAAG
jgi:hypothetical protein